MSRRVFVITGANRGFGNALTRSALSRGHQVEAISRSDKTNAVPAACNFTRVECSDVKETERFWGSILERYPTASRIVLINNAGLYIKKPFEETDFNDFERTIKSNLYCAFNMIDGFLRRYEAGAIINIVSTSAITSETPRSSLAMKSAYSASKAAEKALVQSISAAVAHRNFPFTNYFPRNINTWSNQAEPDSFDVLEFADWVIDKCLDTGSYRLSSCKVLPF